MQEKTLFQDQFHVTYISRDVWLEHVCMTEDFTYMTSDHEHCSEIKISWLFKRPKTKVVHYTCLIPQ